MNDIAVQVSWSIQLLLSCILVAKCCYQFYVKVFGSPFTKPGDNNNSPVSPSQTDSSLTETGGGGGSNTPVSSSHINMSVRKDTLTKAPQEAPTVERHATRTETLRNKTDLPKMPSGRQQTQTARPTTFRRPKTWRDKLHFKNMDITTRMLLVAIVFGICFIIFDILKLSMDQAVGTNVAITIFFVIGGQSFWTYTWMFAFNLVNSSIRSNLGGRAKEMNNILQHFRKLCMACVGATATAFLVIFFGLFSTDPETIHGLQRGAKIYHYVLLGTQICLGVTIFLVYLNDLIKKLKEAQSKLDASKTNDLYVHTRALKRIHLAHKYCVETRKPNMTRS